MFMGFWQVGVVGNDYGTHPPLLSRHLVPQNLRNIHFLLIFSIFPWRPTKSHMSFCNSYAINFVTVLIRSSLKNSATENICKPGFRKSLKEINQTVFKLDFWPKSGFPKTRVSSPVAPRGVYISRNDPQKKICFWKCQKT